MKTTKRTSDASIMKCSETGAALLFTLFLVGLAGCDKRQEAPGLAGVIQRYNKERLPGNKVGNLVEENLKRGEMLSSPFHYSLAGQILMVEGDFDAAIKALNVAVSIDPKIDAPHFLLAEVYYRLALFDMFDRGLCSIDLLPSEKIPEAALHHGHLRTEIQELLGDGRPKSYIRVLASKGLDERARLSVQMYLLMLTKDQIIPAGQEGLEAILQDLGIPKALPVPTYKPDDRAKEILTMAQKEMEIAQQGTHMDVPPGLRVINREEMVALAARLRGLLAAE